MIEWSDDAIVLSARPHGEGAAVVHLLTRLHGRHAGLVRGGASRRQRATYEPGNAVRATWRARLPDHLGAFTCELVHSHAAAWLDDPARLAGIVAGCVVADSALPEREPHPEVLAGLAAWLDTLDGPHWAAAYVRWEIGLLDALGYGLDLARCAATGSNEMLAYVSPRSGRAVSAAAAEPWRDRLLRLPPFLSGGAAPSDADIADGLALTGWFLNRSIFHPTDRDLPPARARFSDRFAREHRIL